MGEPIKNIEARASRYVNVPMAKPDHNELMNLIARLRLGRRSQGAVLARLVRDELCRLDIDGNVVGARNVNYAVLKPEV